MTEQLTSQEKITFQRVIQEVINPGKCSNCGACEMVCALDAANVISHPPSNWTRTLDLENCEQCGLCYATCPRSTFSTGCDDEKAISNLGNYMYMRTYQTAVDEVAEVCQDGGLVTSVLLYLLDNDLVDAVLVTRKDENWHPEAFLTNDRDEIINSAGTIYSTIPVYDAFKPLLNITPDMLEKFGVEKVDFMRVAMVALPCQMAALRRMQEIEIFPSNIITYRIGLFCYENFDYNVLFEKKIAGDLNIPISDLKSMNIKGKMIINRKSGETVKLDPEEFQPLSREGCHWCDDLTSRDSDISCGGIGAPNGWTTCIVRTDRGLTLLERAARAGYIKEGNVPKVGLVSKIARKKIKKAKKD